MEPRLNPYKRLPESLSGDVALQAYVDSCGLERPLLELVKLRASQINGCAYCMDMHTKDARALGETEQRLYLLNAWRESPCTQSVKGPHSNGPRRSRWSPTANVPDEVYGRATIQFQPEELANLTLAIATINSWNRLSIAFRAVPGAYKSNLQRPEAKA